MLMESGMGCCCPKEDALFWKNQHIDAMKQLVQVRQENLALRQQLNINTCARKDLDEKLDKAAADYKALWAENEDLKSQLASEKAQSDEKANNAARCYAALAVERNNLAETVTRMEKAIRDLDERNGTLREHLAKTNASLKTQQGMQSKNAKQANEIKRLTEENEGLKHNNEALNNGFSDYMKQTCDLLSERVTLKRENEALRGALNIAAKDAEANFELGKIKGMEEIWDELRETYRNRILRENEKIFGYGPVGEIIDNLSPTWFMNKAMEYHEQKEKETREIKIGDEVEILDKFCPDNDPHSDIGVVVTIRETQTNCEPRIYTVIGPKLVSQIDDGDIECGVVRKTGKHYNAIPFDYFM